MPEWYCGKTHFEYDDGPDLRGPVKIKDKKTGHSVTVRMIDLFRFVGLRIRDKRVQEMESSDPVTLLIHG